MRLINTETFKLEDFSDIEAPRYAILSHTWGRDIEELNFLDVRDGIHKINDKQKDPGLAKFKACCEQAKADNYGYAWIDTCCIDKTNLVELGEAINSMFRWYSLAAVCYAYLSDVPDDDDPSVPGSRFRTSRWFKRGWTLQELLAPKHVRFYNLEWHLIGTKGNRCTIIQEITSVPRQFLLGVAEWHTASVAQRMSWAAQRETKRAEDLAYCLLGIFGITMPMIYGEGGREAFFRLQEQIMKTTRDDSILAWGFNDEPSMSNPQKSRDGDMFIHGDILAATPSDFANSGHIIAREQATNPLHSLDIFGGSLRAYFPLLTMGPQTFGLLTCGPKSDAKQVAAIPLAKINSAVANEYVRPRGSPSVLQPLPTSDASPELIHIKKDGQKHISTKNQQFLFYDVDVFAKLGLEVIDVVPRACWDDQLSLISQTSTDQILIRVCQSEGQSLDFVIAIEVHQPDSGMDHLYCVFTCHKDTALNEIAGKFQREALEAFQQASASNETLHLRIKLESMEGNITFIAPESMTRPPAHTINATMALENLDIVLESTRLLWERKKIDADITELNQRVEDGKNLLGPFKQELEAIEAEFKRLEARKSMLVEEEQSKIQEIQRLEEREGDMRKRKNEIPPQVIDLQKRLREFYHAKGYANGWIPFSSAMAMCDIDIINTLLYETTDTRNDDKRYKPRNINKIRSLVATDENGLKHQHRFSRRTPLSWARMHGDIATVELLLDTNIIDNNSEDNHGRKLLRWALDEGSYDIVRLMLQRYKLAYLRKFCGHRRPVCSVAFSHDSKLILSGSEDETIKLWDSATSECLHTFQGHKDIVATVAFSHDSKLVLSGSRDHTIRLWDSTTSEHLHTFRGHKRTVHSVTFSHNSKFVLSGSYDSNIKLWDAATGECLRTFRDHTGPVLSVAFSHDSKLVASGSSDTMIMLWNSATGTHLRTFQGHSDQVLSVAFSYDSKLILSGSADKTIKLWDSEAGKCLQTFQGHNEYVYSIAFSHDSKLVVSGSADKIRLVRLVNVFTRSGLITPNIVVPWPSRMTPG